VDDKRLSLRELVKEVADMVALRAADGSNFGTVLVAEGLLTAIPEFRTLISELEAIALPCPPDEVLAQLTQWSRALFQSLPDFIQQQLHLERQSNAALQRCRSWRRSGCWLGSSRTSSGRRKRRGTFDGSFSPVCQFIGYQARCSVPSDFDMDYAYTLGATSAILAASNLSGYMAVVSDLSQPVEDWRVGGVPLTAMLKVPAGSASGTFYPRPAIFPRRVDLKAWCAEREGCAKFEMYQNPGPIQLSGPSAGRIAASISGRFSYLQELERMRRHLSAIRMRCRPGCDPRSVRVATQTLATLQSVLDEFSAPGEEIEQREK